MGYRPPRVLNIQRHRLTKDAVLVDRQTEWGNPFRMLGEGTREHVCNQHREWLRWWTVERREVVVFVEGRRYSNKWVVEHVVELEGHDLVCHCAPKQCHADLLLKMANEPGFLP